MFRRLLGWLATGLTLVFAFSLLGCSGGNSTPNDQPAQIGAVTVSDNGTTATITVAFNVSTNPPVTDLEANNVRFTVAKLVPGTNGDASYWQSYLNTTETATDNQGNPIGNAPDGTVTPGSASAVQATAQRASAPGGVFTNNGDGSYTFKLSTNFRAVTGVTWEPNLTHRIAMQTNDNVTNSIYDFIPSNLNATPTTTREIVADVTCSRCHEKFAFHGGDRVATKYCVTCHNPGTVDANSGNTMDFKVMVHKIHYGKDLPSITGNMWEYAIWGFNDTKHNYSEVAYPHNREVSAPAELKFDCTICHNGANTATPQGDNWKNVPTIEACSSCHDTTSFEVTPPAGFTAHSGGPLADNTTCALCHPADSGGTITPEFPLGANVTTVHQLPVLLAAQKFQYNIISVTDPGGNPVDPSDLVRVTFSITDPTNADAPYNLASDPAFTAPGSFGSARIAILIGWDTDEYTNTGSGSSNPPANDGPPAQPISITLVGFGAIALPAPNVDGSYTVTATTPVSGTATGTGVVAIEGHPAADFDGDGTWSDEVAVKNVFKYFTITDATVQARRDVVDINKCKECHGVLSLHGNNRSEEIQVCVICHDPNATDIRQRPAGAPTGTADNKREEAIDFKYMIHAIHAGDMDRGIKTANDLGFRENGIVLWGFGPTEHDFSDIRLPSELETLKNCERCHISTGSGTYELPLDDDVLPTTFWTQAGEGTGADRSIPTDDTKMTPTTSVCSSCHDNSVSIAHMESNGGDINLAPGDSSAETCTLCHAPGKDVDIEVAHEAEQATVIGVIAPPPSDSGGDGGQSQEDLCGPGPIASQPAGHTSALDCCSCHGFN